MGRKPEYSETGRATRAESKEIGHSASFAVIANSNTLKSEPILTEHEGGLATVQRSVPIPVGDQSGRAADTNFYLTEQAGSQLMYRDTKAFRGVAVSSLCPGTNFR